MKWVLWGVALSALPSHPSLPCAAEWPCWKRWGWLASEGHSEPHRITCPKCFGKRKIPLRLPLHWRANYCEESDVQRGKSSIVKQEKQKGCGYPITARQSESAQAVGLLLLLMAIGKSSSSFASWIPQQFLPFTHTAKQEAIPLIYRAWALN